MRGKFIVFEGIDGCGKGTQLKLVTSYLWDLNKEIDIYITREPTRDFKEIRERMAKSKNIEEDAEWYAQAFLEDRINHLRNYIVPMFKKGTYVLCDRYKYSTLAYQHTQGIDFKKLNDMHLGLLIPDLTLIYDCSAEIAFERRKNEGATDVFDKYLEFQEKLRMNYLELKNKLPDENIILISSMFPEEKVFETTKKYLDKIL